MITPVPPVVTTDKDSLMKLLQDQREGQTKIAQKSRKFMRQKTGTIGVANGQESREYAMTKQKTRNLGKMTGGPTSESGATAA